MDLMETTHLLPIFLIGYIRTSRHSFTSRLGIIATAQKALDDLFTNIKKKNPTFLVLYLPDWKEHFDVLWMLWSFYCNILIFQREGYFELEFYWLWIFHYEPTIVAAMPLLNIITLNESVINKIGSLS